MSHASHWNPRLSIGLPVQNGEEVSRPGPRLVARPDIHRLRADRIGQCVDDRTGQICRKYAERDGRIRYDRMPQNMVGAFNQNYVLTLARGDLFKWAAHDDLYGPELLEKCVAVFDREPDVVLCHSDMAIIDQHGDLVHHYAYTMPTDSPSAAVRFKAPLVTDGGDDEYGAMRTAVLHQVLALVTSRWTTRMCWNAQSATMSMRPWRR